jgi:uncharacterized protein (TIGR02646 family)
LPQHAEQYLASCTEEIAPAADPADAAARRWYNKRASEFGEIRRVLQEMASGIERCMYCEGSEGTDIEHFWPKSTFPERAFDWLNYLLACAACNSNHKRTRFPRDDTGAPLLIDPTAEDPTKHLRLTPSTGKYTARTPKGASSIEVFGLDRKVLERSRRNAWEQHQALIIRYAQLVREGRSAAAGKLKRAIREAPHAGVLVEIIRVAGSNSASRYLDRRCLDALQAHPEIQSWLR